MANNKVVHSSIDSFVGALLEDKKYGLMYNRSLYFIDNCIFSQEKLMIYVDKNRKICLRFDIPLGYHVNLSRKRFRKYKGEMGGIFSEHKYKGITLNATSSVVVRTDELSIKRHAEKSIQMKIGEEVADLIRQIDKENDPTAYYNKAERIRWAINSCITEFNLLDEINNSMNWDITHGLSEENFNFWEAQKLMFILAGGEL